MTEENGEHKRRARYAGSHPRKFHEKYKELEPEKYAEDVQKIMEKGNTLAGSHRPIMVDEVMAVLEPKPGMIAIDCTIGYGGHAQQIIKRISPDGTFLGLDIDPIEIAKTETRLRNKFPNAILHFVNTNYAALPRAMADAGIELADIILADLGVSSMQLDNPERGFTWKDSGPLDLRMNPNKGKSAAQYLQTIAPEKLALILEDYADEPLAEEIAMQIAGANITLTTELTSILKSISDDDATIRRTFQALRIAVNNEFSALETLLKMLPYCLKPGGRAAILSFHSGEDRRIKKAFSEGYDNGTYSMISQEVIRPTPQEKYDNPRSSSAKMRYCEKSRN
jgi:16S rRNA (cytosine1402-N4)-methyltransferase